MPNGVGVMSKIAEPAPRPMRAIFSSGLAKTKPAARIQIRSILFFPARQTPQ
jgi:hypothetical protein